MTLGAVKSAVQLEFHLRRIELGKVNSNPSFLEMEGLKDKALSLVLDAGLGGEHGAYALMMSAGSGADIPFDVGKVSVGKNGARAYKNRFSDGNWKNKVSKALGCMTEYLKENKITQKRRVILWLVHAPPQATQVRESYITDLENVLLQRMSHHANPDYYYSQKNVGNETSQISNPLYRVRGVSNLRGSNKDCWKNSSGGRLSSDEIKLGEAFSKSFRW